MMFIQLTRWALTAESTSVHRQRRIFITTEYYLFMPKTTRGNPWLYTIILIIVALFTGLITILVPLFAFYGIKKKHSINELNLGEIILIIIFSIILAIPEYLSGFPAGLLIAFIYLIFAIVLYLWQKDKSKTSPTRAVPLSKVAIFGILSGIAISSIFFILGNATLTCSAIGYFYFVLLLIFVGAVLVLGGMSTKGKPVAIVVYSIALIIMLALGVAFYVHIAFASGNPITVGTSC